MPDYRYYRPFSPGWFFQRTMVVIRERRLPDLSLFKRKIRSLWKKSEYKAASRYESLREDLLQSDRFHEEDPFDVGSAGDRKERINSYFDGVYVVSPQKRSDSRLAMVRKIRKLNIRATFIETDGDKSPAEVWREGLLRVIRDASAKQHKRILYLEDNVIFAREFHGKLDEAISKLPSDWELLYLGAIQDGWNEGTDVLSLDKKNLTPASLLTFYHPVRTQGSFAVGISCNIYHLLEKSLHKKLVAAEGFLAGFSGIHRDKSFVVYPNLVIPDPQIKGKYDGIRYESCRWDISGYEKGPEQELVSVIMPAYNAEKTIEQSIRSVLRQTYRNIEMIVSDDGSTDTTREIVRRLMKEDPRVQLVESPVNKGCYFARNAAIRASGGRYIAVQDSDDISFSKRIEKQLIPLVSGNALFTLAWILRSRLQIFGLDIGDEPGMIKKVLEKRIPRPDGTYSYWDRPILGFMTSVFRREIFEELGLFWEFRFGADAEFFERIIFNRTGRILDIDGPNVHSLLLHTGSLPEIYKRLDEILLISSEMGGQNITNTYRQEELREFIRNYRAKYAGDPGYEYPLL